MIKNFSSRFRDMNGRRDIGGNMMSETSELTTEVKAVAIIKPTATSNTLSRRVNWRKPVHALLTLRLIVEGVWRKASRASSDTHVDMVDDQGWISKKRKGGGLYKRARI